MNPQYVRLRASTMRLRDIHHTKRELDCKLCEDVFETNPLIYTSSVVSQSVQVCKKNEEEMAAHHITTLDEKGE